MSLYKFSGWRRWNFSGKVCESPVHYIYWAGLCVSSCIFDFLLQIAAVFETSASHVSQKHKKTRRVQGFAGSCSLLDLGSGRFLSGSGKLFREDALPDSGEGGLPVVP
jgi:hypothetical protein